MSYLSRSVLLITVAMVGCSSRPKVGTDRDKTKDGSPPVVYVDHKGVKARPVVTPQVPLVDEAEPNDEVGRAQPIEFPKGIKGTMGAPQAALKPGKPPRGDEDVYSWLVASAPGATAKADGGGGGGDGAVARVELGGVPGLQLSLEVLDGDGKKIASASDGGVGEAQVLPNLFVEVGKTYYLRVKESGKPRGDATHPYTLVASLAPFEAGDELEPNDTPETATVLDPAAGAASGFYGRRRDEDWLRIGATTGAAGVLRLELGAVDGVTPVVRIADARGTTLVEAKGQKGEAILMRNAPAPGDGGGLVLVRAEAGRSSDLRWTLRASVEPALPGFEVEPNDTDVRATALPGSGEPVHAYLWPGDVDLYRLRSEAAGLVRIELAAPEGSEKVDLKMELYASGSRGLGKPLVKVDEGGAGKGEVMPDWYLPAGGELLVRVTGRARDSAFNAPYKLSARMTFETADHPVEREPNESAVVATPIEVNRPVEGWLAPKGDEDWYSFTVPPGAGRISATIAAAPPGTSPSLRIVGAGKLVLATVTGKRVSAVAEGPVWIVVKDAGGKSSATSYNLTLSLDGPE